MLTAAGCGAIYVDVASGALAQRPHLESAIESLHAGDTLVVAKLDRLGRSLRHLVATVHLLHSRGVSFSSLQEGIDTSGPDGEATLHLFLALAAFKRDLFNERTQAGLSAAKARGRSGGRKPALSPERAALVCELYEGGDHTVAEIAELLGTSRATIYRVLKAASKAGSTDRNASELTAKPRRPQAIRSGGQVVDLPVRRTAP